MPNTFFFWILHVWKYIWALTVLGFLWPTNCVSYWSLSMSNLFSNSTYLAFRICFAYFTKEWVGFGRGWNIGLRFRKQCEDNSVINARVVWHQGSAWHRENAEVIFMRWRFWSKIKSHGDRTNVLVLYHFGRACYLLLWSRTYKPWNFGRRFLWNVYCYLPVKFHGVASPKANLSKSHYSY